MGKSKRYPGVYQIFNISSGRSYIGSSKNCLKRMQNHRNRLRSNANKNPYLQQDWNRFGQNDFVFRILENLSDSLTNKELELYEAKWIDKFKSNTKEYGYNITFPGNIRQCEKDANIFNKQLVDYVCISKEKILFLTGINEVRNITSVSPNTIVDLASYWEGKGRKKSNHGWIIVKKENYNPLFDYISYKKERFSSYKYGKKLTAKEYYKIRKDSQPDYCTRKRKPPEEIVPYKDRKLKRIPVIAINIETGKEKRYLSIKECSVDFVKGKVIKCLNNPFGRYKHRGHYFRKAMEIGHLT